MGRERVRKRIEVEGERKRRRRAAQIGGICECMAMFVRYM